MWSDALLLPALLQNFVEALDDLGHGLPEQNSKLPWHAKAVWMLFESFRKVAVHGMRKVGCPEAPQVPPLVQSVVDQGGVVLGVLPQGLVHSGRGVPVAVGGKVRNQPFPLGIVGVGLPRDLHQHQGPRPPGPVAAQLPQGLRFHGRHLLRGAQGPAGHDPSQTEGVYGNGGLPGPWPSLGICDGDVARHFNQKLVVLTLVVGPAELGHFHAPIWLNCADPLLPRSRLYVVPVSLPYGGLVGVVVSIWPLRLWILLEVVLSRWGQAPVGVC